MSSSHSNQPIAESQRFREAVPRRDFLGLTALWSFLSTGVVMLAGALRLPMPSVFPETGSKFRIGPPTRYPRGTAVRIPDRQPARRVAGR